MSNNVTVFPDQTRELQTIVQTPASSGLVQRQLNWYRYNHYAIQADEAHKYSTGVGICPQHL